MKSISPNNFYSISEVRTLFGENCLRRLRKHGLTAVAGLYHGENILASFRNIWLHSARQRVLGKEVNLDSERALETHSAHGSVQPVPKPELPYWRGDPIFTFGIHDGEKFYRHAIAAWEVDEEEPFKNWIREYTEGPMKNIEKSE